MLITDDTIDTLIDINPTYQRYQNYSTDEAFAQEEFHKPNVPEMDQFCVIEFGVAKRKYQLDNDEIANWGKNPNWIKKIRYIVKHFDELLPDYFNHKMMGKFQFYFCKWALPGNIKKGNEYFIKHYKGNLKVSQYAAVNNHGKNYDQHSEEVKNFHKAIDILLKRNNMLEMAAESA
jgi:hypothetical protein